MGFTVSNNGHTLHYKGCDIVLHNNSDITKFNGDFVVNAAKPSLKGGGGVDGAIHAAAGSKLKKACMKALKKMNISKIHVADAVKTKGYKLPATAVIHTVGPNVKKYYKNNFSKAKQDLFNTYENTIKEANKHGYTKGAFPGISVGVYKFPKTDAARIALKSICHQIDKKTSVTKFHLYCNDKKGTSFSEYTKLFKNAVKNGKIG